MTIFFWYILSCLIVWGYDKLKKYEKKPPMNPEEQASYNRAKSKREEQLTVERDQERSWKEGKWLRDQEKRDRRGMFD